MPRPSPTRGYLGERQTLDQDIFPFYPTDLGTCLLHLYRLVRGLDAASQSNQTEQQARGRRRDPRVRAPLSREH